MPASADEFRQSMDEALRTLRELRAHRPDPDAAETRGEGTTADGLITVVAGPGGRIESVTVAPQALREGSDHLGEQLTLAVNAALDDLRERTLAGAPDVPDPAVLLERLQEVQQQSVRQMRSFLGALTDAQARIGRQRG
ncbi:YbaB/EbfC family nucleoid-associated protein [Micromonospora mirobrigensis]|uniref:YbaB/EbfC DNA-binding family protein n=1 Tax=Micromonospora mirobrigensis TaxID=262898 RepID=A0A1C4VJM2_9ACTN|nr:YbaB/EbfC family nucleoid-associated protein [Micromonospora mirobrigensis]SCE84202.1 YbaB/EbfC DNA-binding family protein [Micromonospora mirobrigensis]